MTRMRARIAERLMQSKNSIAMLTSFNEVNLGKVMAMRKDLGEPFEKANGIKLGFMSFFAKAAAEALQALPGRQRLGRRQRRDLPRLRRHLDRGVDRQGPGHAGAAQRRAHELRRHREGHRRLRQGAREGKLQLEDLQGGTFTITNGGTFGSLMSTPIVNPPQSAILGMHTIKERADRRERPGRRRADDVHRAELRPPHHRRQGRGAVPGRHQEPARESAPHAAGAVMLSPLPPGGWGWGAGFVRASPAQLSQSRIAPIPKRESDDATSEKFDVVVIGAGPAGYHAAIRAAQLGLKTACIDAALGKDGKPALGGTCLAWAAFRRRRCSTSRASSGTSRTCSANTASASKDAEIDIGTMIGRKDKIVKQFTGGIAMLFKANKVTPFYGFGQLQPGNVVSVKQHDGSDSRTQGHATSIIAAGSDSDRTAVREVRRQDHRRQRRRARLHRSAQAPGRDRRRRDRPGARQRVEAPGLAKSRSSKRCRTSSPPPTRTSRRRPRANSRSRASTSASAPRSPRPRSRRTACT